MNTASRIIILNSTKVGDKSLVLHCLSRELGRRSFIISAGKGGALWQPLNIIDAEVVENKKSDLWRLHAASAAYPLNGIRSNGYKTSISLFMSEVLYRAIREGVYEDKLYEWAERSILTLDALDGDFANFHLRFLLEMATALGFAPSEESLAPFANEHLEDIRNLLREDFSGCMLLPLNGKSRSEIAGCLLDYIGFHLDTPLNIRSLAVLSELYR